MSDTEFSGLCKRSGHRRCANNLSDAPYSHSRSVYCRHKLQALVYNILPSTTAVFIYAIGSRKLSANEQFFVGAQTVVSLLQTTQLISDVCFITDPVAYASSNKTTIVGIKTELFFFFLPCLHACLGIRLLPVLPVPKLRASFSGTFLQTLPDLVTPLKGYSLSPRSCPAMWSAPSKRFQY